MRTGGRFLKIAAVTAALGAVLLFGAAPFFQAWRAAILSAVAPVFSGASRLAASGNGWLSGFFSGRVSRLEAERLDLMSQLAELSALRRENETLRLALALADEGETGALPARAVAFVREGRDEYLILDRGAEDGIGVGDVVINTRRVLGGTVTAVDRRTARALLVSSPSQSIDVLLPAAQDLRAIARGANARELAIELVPPDAAVAAGDIVLASSRASGGRRPLLVAEVREARQAEHEAFRRVRAVHLFDPSDTDVIVLLAP